MEQSEILEGNRIIAEFMRLIMEDANSPYNLPKYYYPDNDGRKKGKFSDYFHELEYDSSWDWLMPVVEKIEDNKAVAININNWNNNGKYQCRIFWCYDLVSDNERQEIVIITGDNKIQVVWQAAVEFIRWHNKTKKYEKSTNFKRL